MERVVIEVVSSYLKLSLIEKGTISQGDFNMALVRTLNIYHCSIRTLLSSWRV